MNKKNDSGACGSCGGSCGGDEKIAYEAGNIFQGPYNTYDPEEDIFTEGEIKDGRQHGEYIEYYGMDKKIIRVKGSYSNGLLHGEWLYYEKNGEVIKVDIYNEGRLLETRK